MQKILESRVIRACGAAFVVGAVAGTVLSYPAFATECLRLMAPSVWVVAFDSVHKVGILDGAAEAAEAEVWASRGAASFGNDVPAGQTTITWADGTFAVVQ